MEPMLQPRPRGRRTFLAGSIALIVFGSVHVLAVYQALFLPPADAKLAAIDEAARAYSIELGPFKPTAFGCIQILNASYSVLLIYAGVLNLLAARPAAQAGRLRTLAACNVLFVGLLLAIVTAFQFPPPMLFAAPALGFFAASWWLQSRGREPRG